jgi:hypothetical protein
VFFLLWLFSSANRKGLIIFIAILFVVNSAVQLVTGRGESQGSSSSYANNRLLTLVEDRQLIKTPNVYLLIYDAYVANETMQAYGIDNSAQEAHLQQLGFKLYPHTYSVGSETVETMSLLLNTSDDYYGNLRRGISGDGVVQNIFKSLGYKTAGIFTSDYEFRGLGSSYDFSFPTLKEQNVLIATAILMGEFRFDVGVSWIPHEEFVDVKRNFLSEISSEPVFVYAHSDLPNHSQNSGACLPEETSLYADRLSEANDEMNQDLALILSNDPGGIIIIAGDHGPFLTKNCSNTSLEYNLSEITRLDIQDRYGTFLAIRWPSNDYAGYDQITVLQDLFPAVFATLFRDPSLLEAKIDPLLIRTENISGATVEDGLIHGGVNDGEVLFPTAK